MPAFSCSRAFVSIGAGLFQQNERGTFVPVEIGERALDALRFLVERPGDVVSRDEIMAAHITAVAAHHFVLWHLSAVRGRQQALALLNVELACAAAETSPSA